MAIGTVAALLHSGQTYALTVWSAWRAPLVAVAAGLLAALVAPALRSRRLGGCAAGIGAVAGFCVLAGLAWPPTAALQRLAPLIAAATLVAAFASPLGRRVGVAGAVAAALLGGWFMVGAPLHPGPPLPWIEAGGVAAILALGAFGLAALGIGQVVLAAVSLACGLSAARVGHVWVLAALVPGAATLGAALAGDAARKQLAMQPAAMAIAGVAAAWLLATGDVARLTLRPVEAAVVAPVLALWLAARLAPRLRVAASGVGLAAATLAVWMIAGGR